MTPDPCEKQSSRERHAAGRLHEMRPLTSMDNFASDGFAGPQPDGRFLQGLMSILDHVTSPLHRVSAARLHVVRESEQS